MMASLTEPNVAEGLSADASSNAMGAAAMLLSLQQSQHSNISRDKGASMKHTPKPGQDAGLSTDSEESSPFGEPAAKRANRTVDSDSSEDEAVKGAIRATQPAFFDQSYNPREWEPVVIQSSIGNNANLCIGYSGAIAGKKIHRCAQCSKSFPSVSKLVRHSRVHTKDKPFACPSCATRFTQRSSLKQHLTRHVDVNPGQVLPPSRKTKRKATVNRPASTSESPTPSTTAPEPSVPIPSVHGGAATPEEMAKMAQMQMMMMMTNPMMAQQAMMFQAMMMQQAAAAAVSKASTSPSTSGEPATSLPLPFFPMPAVSGSNPMAQLAQQWSAASAPSNSTASDNSTAKTGPLPSAIVVSKPAVSTSMSPLVITTNSSVQPTPSTSAVTQPGPMPAAITVPATTTQSVAPSAAEGPQPPSKPAHTAMTGSTSGERTVAALPTTAVLSMEGPCVTESSATGDTQPQPES
eukprot:m.45785 g.45785  ORF g.45785 m.45785 type:complete len:464 (-) comp13105_c0_seq4:5-1396(-)